ncbi:hypothetical protein [Lacinutrix chionoecetis]
MKNQINLTFKISNFEPISENSENMLVGGFSLSLSGAGEVSLDTISNNCFGGNCTWGCGDGKNIGCNTVTGCGVVSE